MSSSTGRLPTRQTRHSGRAGVPPNDRCVLQRLRHHGEAGLAHGRWGGTWKEEKLGLDTWHYGRWGHCTFLLLLLLDPVIFHQLSVLFLLFTDLES